MAAGRTKAQTDRLTAAAPALLAATRQALDVLEELTSEEFSRGGDRPAREALEAAYRLALGAPSPQPAQGPMAAGIAAGTLARRRSGIEPDDIAGSLAARWRALCSAAVAYAELYAANGDEYRAFVQGFQAGWSLIDTCADLLIGEW